MHAKRRVVAMSHSHSAQIEGLAYKPSDRAASQQRAIKRPSLVTGRQDSSAKRHRLVRFSSDKTTRRKGDNYIGCVVAIHIATHKMYKISHHNVIYLSIYCKNNKNK
jgi:hypothetical protein